MAGSVFEWGGWTFEPAEWRLLAPDSAPVSLPNRTLALLALLLERAPRLVTKDEILTLVWSDSVVEEGNIAFHIATLRKALDCDDGSCIETVRGRGYRFVAPVTRRVTPTTPPPEARADAVAPAGQTAQPTSVEDTVPAVQVSVAAQPRQMPWFPVMGALGFAALIAGAAWFALSYYAPPVRTVTVLPSIDGLAEAVVTRVSRDTTLDARLGTAGAQPEDAVAAGQRLHAESILTTRVDQTVQPWRVRTQLTRTRDQRLLWSWAFDVPGDSSATANATIAAKIGFGLGRHLGAVRAGPAGGAATVNPVAHDLSLQARVQWRLRTPYSIQQAITLYERAISIDPGYAPAYAGLADCYNLTMSGLTPEVRYPRALEYAEKSVALDPDDAAGHTSLAFLRYKFEWRWDESEAEFKKAIALDPDYALAHHWYGEFLGLMGRYEEAITQLRLAAALDPQTLAIQSDLVPPLLRAGRIAEARAVVEAAAATNPNWPVIPYRLADILEAEGRERDAVESRWRWMLLSGVSLATVDRLRAAYNSGGMEGMTRAEIADYLESEAATPGAWLNATFLSRLYGRLGERAEALRWLNTALDRREDASISLIIHPDYDSLRDDPEFARQLARVGLTPLQRR